MSCTAAARKATEIQQTTLERRWLIRLQLTVIMAGEFCSHDLAHIMTRSAFTDIRSCLLVSDGQATVPSVLRAQLMLG